MGGLLCVLFDDTIISKNLLSRKAYEFYTILICQTRWRGIMIPDIAGMEG